MNKEFLIKATENSDSGEVRWLTQGGIVTTERTEAGRFTRGMADNIARDVTAAITSGDGKPLWTLEVEEA